MNNKKGIALIQLLIGMALLAIGIFLLSQNLGVEAPIKKLVSSYNNKDAKKLLNCFDFAGMTVFYELGEDNLDDFWEEYQEFKDTDEYDELAEKYEKQVEELTNSDEDEYEDDDDFNVKMTLEKIKSKKKVSKNLYKVKAKIKIEYEDENDNESDTATTIVFYVLSNGLNNKIVGVSLSDLLSSFNF